MLPFTVNKDVYIKIAWVTCNVIVQIIVVNQFFMKLFFTSDINIVSECQHMFNFRLPSEQLVHNERTDLSVVSTVCDAELICCK